MKGDLQTLQRKALSLFPDARAWACHVLKHETWTKRCDPLHTHGETSGSVAESDDSKQTLQCFSSYHSRVLESGCFQGKLAVGREGGREGGGQVSQRSVSFFYSFSFLRNGGVISAVRKHEANACLSTP